MTLEANIRLLLDIYPIFFFYNFDSERSFLRTVPRGVLRFEMDMGVPLEPQNPYPSLRVILAETGTYF